MSIDWNAAIKAYNRDNSTDYKTRKELLFDLYAKHLSTLKMEKELYISSPSIRKAMKNDKLKLLPKGHRFPSQKQAVMLALNTTVMTLKEIHIVTGFTKNGCWQLLKRLNLSWKRVK